MGETLIPEQVDRLYLVNTPQFEGPLELLLHLIERSELDITKMSLASVTDQFLGYLEYLFDKEPQDVSNFLVVASKLLQIKSEIILPRPPPQFEEEDPGEALLRQLIEYKKFKTISEYFSVLGSTNRRTYLRTSSPPHMSNSLDLRGVTVSDLYNYLLGYLIEDNAVGDVSSRIEFHKVSIKEKLGLITRTLTRDRNYSFTEFLAKEDSWTDVVVMFLAVLELMKQRWVNVSQDNLFGEMVIHVSDRFMESFNFVLEFDD